MSEAIWEHIILTIIATAPAAIAAASSLRNGRILKENGRTKSGQTNKATKKKTPNGDWYAPPDV